MQLLHYGLSMALDHRLQPTAATHWRRRTRRVVVPRRLLARHRGNNLAPAAVGARNRSRDLHSRPRSATRDRKQVGDSRDAVCQ